jgi:hypothetical protein
MYLALRLKWWLRWRLCESSSPKGMATHLTHNQLSVGFLSNLVLVRYSKCRCISCLLLSSKSNSSGVRRRGLGLMPIKSFSRFVDGVIDPQVLGSSGSTGTGTVPVMASGHSQCPHREQAVFQLHLSHLQIVGCLKVKPVLRGLTQRQSQPQRQFSSDWALAFEQARHTSSGNANCIRVC